MPDQSPDWPFHIFATDPLTGHVAETSDAAAGRTHAAPIEKLHEQATGNSERLRSTR
jgi:hypothetical protein